MVTELHNPNDIIVNGRHNFYQIWFDEATNGLLSWNGNGFTTVGDGFMESKAMNNSELVPDYYRAIDIAQSLNYSGTISISGLPPTSAAAPSVATANSGLTD